MPSPVNMIRTHGFIECSHRWPFPVHASKTRFRQFAIYNLQQLNDTTRLAAYGDKVPAANPNSIPTLILLST